MNKNKVIFIGPAYPYRGGIAAFNENLASIFQSNGWDCKILTFIQQYPNLLFPGKNQLTTEDPKPNLTITRGIYSTNPLNWLKMSKEIVEEAPSLVITQYWMPFMAPAFGTILRGIKKALPSCKIATVVHNFKPHESRIGDKQLNKFIAKRTDTLICLSESVKQEVVESVKNKPVYKLFHPIYDHYGESLSMSDARQALGWDEDRKYLLFFGLIRKYKGVDILLEALGKLDKNKDYTLFIAGEFYENKKKYQKIIDEHGLKDKVEIRDEYIPNEDVPKLFCGADAIVLPYKNATQSGVVPIALHFNRPCIVTNVGSLSNLLEKHGLGLICEPTPENMAQKLTEFLDDQHQFSEDYEIIKQELSWQAFYDQLTDKLEIHEA